MYAKETRDYRPVSGSSPRLRGTPAVEVVGSVPWRFIPAPAGNRPAHRGRDRYPPVHPRACGEHPSLACTSIRESGSSPRLRGTRARIRIHIAFLRFIPAPAGNTVGQPMERGSGPVHPRACGEHCINAACTLRSAGSSPRLRGTRPAGCWSTTARRFIPAPAGNTSACWTYSQGVSVHPRACGEHGQGRAT